jgi:hypothetical protein
MATLCENYLTFLYAYYMGPEAVLTQSRALPGL